MSPILAPAIRHIRSVLDLPPRSFHRTVRVHDRGHWPVRYGVSPVVVPRPRDWRPGLEVSGYFWPHHGSWTPPPALLAFLDAGPPPVLVGFGSMAPRDPGRWSTVIAEALRRSGDVPLYIIGHSLGGALAVEASVELVKFGITPDHVFTIDPFIADGTVVPPGLVLTNFYQEQSWYINGRRIEGATENMVLSNTTHFTITLHPLVQSMIVDTILNRATAGQTGGRY
jgi:hypothetical protein